MLKEICSSPADNPDRKVCTWCVRAMTQQYRFQDPENLTQIWTLDKILTITATSGLSNLHSCSHLYIISIHYIVTFVETALCKCQDVIRDPGYLWDRYYISRARSCLDHDIWMFQRTQRPFARKLGLSILLFSSLLFLSGHLFHSLGYLPLTLS